MCLARAVSTPALDGSSSSMQAPGAPYAQRPHTLSHGCPLLPDRVASAVAAPTALFPACARTIISTPESSSKRVKGTPTSGLIATQRWAALCAAELVTFAMAASDATYLPVGWALSTSIDRLYVRACYGAIANAICGFLARRLSVVLSGTPGIGMSSFVPYLLWRWARDPALQPYRRVVFQRDKDIFLVPLDDGDVTRPTRLRWCQMLCMCWIPRTHCR